MFCRNCGKEMDNNAAVCVQCGVAAGNGASFCPNCGQATAPAATFCTSCGIALTQPVAPSQQKSKIAAGVLGILLGSLGVHNFYLGFTGKAVAQLLITLLTCGVGATVSGIWGLIEGIMILCGNITADANGIPLKE